MRPSRLRSILAHLVGESLARSAEGEAERREAMGRERAVFGAFRARAGEGPLPRAAERAGNGSSSKGRQTVNREKREDMSESESRSFLVVLVESYCSLLL